MLVDEAVITRHGAAELPREIFEYEVLDFVGEGAGSLIYVVTHPETHQLYALKHVLKRKEKDVRFLEQLENEFAVASRFSHPTLRKCFELKDNRTLLRKPTEAVLLMELFDGRPLDSCRPDHPLTTVGYFIQVAQGLAALHATGFIHADLKPNNLLIADDGDVKIIDFGQAVRSGTIKERIQGTPAYMAPEQAKCEPITPRTDVFNFGATLYWALTGRTIPTLYTLNRSDNSFLVDHAISTPAQLERNVPENLSNIVMECIRTNPAKRPDSMIDLQRRLEIIEHVLMRRVA